MIYHPKYIWSTSLVIVPRLPPSSLACAPLQLAVGNENGHEDEARISVQAVQTIVDILLFLISAIAVFQCTIIIPSTPSPLVNVGLVLIQQQQQQQQKQ